MATLFGPVPQEFPVPQLLGDQPHRLPRAADEHHMVLRIAHRCKVSVRSYH